MTTDPPLKKKCVGKVSLYEALSILPCMNAKIISIGISAIIAVTITTGSAHAFCFDEAAAEYDVSAATLWGLAQVENKKGNPLAINWNTNGTYDFGVMQINSSWAETVGLERWSRLNDPCENVKVGAMILSKCLKQYGNTWVGIGCYHSRTPSKRDSYIMKVYTTLNKAGLLRQAQNK